MPNANYYDKIADALIEVLKSATSPDMMQAQLIVMRRMALSGDVVPSRVPAPLNITEIGGYLNLLDTMNEPALRAQVLASILGVAGPNPPVGWFPSSPFLYFASHANDRPGSGAAQASYPTSFSIRVDFLQALASVLDELHACGCALPLGSTARHLPAANGLGPAPTDLLSYIGRTLEIAPAAALIDPDSDPVAVARRSGEAQGAEQIVLRVLDGAAAKAASVSTADWSAWRFDAAATTLSEDTASRRYLPLSPSLAKAGWYRFDPISPTVLSPTSGWGRFVNVTNLIVGVTRYGDEVSLLYSAEQIAGSLLRDRLEWVWDGERFLAP